MLRIADDIAIVTKNRLPKGYPRNNAFNNEK